MIQLKFFVVFLCHSTIILLVSHLSVFDILIIAFELLISDTQLILFSVSRVIMVGDQLFCFIEHFAFWWQLNWVKFRPELISQNMFDLLDWWKDTLCRRLCWRLLKRTFSTSALQTLEATAHWVVLPLGLCICFHHTHRFNGHFPGKPGLASCPLDSQSPVILILSILTVRQNSSYPHDTLDCTLLIYINQHPKGFWSRSIYRLDALPVAQPTASKYWRLGCFYHK